MNVLKTDIPEVLIIEPRVFTDPRGFFLETYHSERYRAHGIDAQFVQDNHSCSAPGTIRGLHYQLTHPQGKLVRVLRGAIYDVAVDIRRGSPTFGRWVATELSAANHRQMYIPPGFAHGFAVPAGEAEVEYKCTAHYAADDQRGIRCDDPALGIPWPVSEPVLSDNDRRLLPLLADRDDLPAYEPARS